MKINKKDIFYQILFFLCIAVSYQNSYETTFAVWIVTLGLTLKNNYSINLLKHISFFAVIFSVAFIVCIFKNYSLFKIIRDITYLLKPIIGLLIGYQLCRLNSKKAFSLFIYTGLIIAIIHILIIIKVVVQHGSLNVGIIRADAGFFSDYEIYCLIILLFYKNFNLNFSKQKIILFTIVIGISSFLYLARTNFIQFAILFVAIKGYFTLNAKSIKVVFSIVAAVLIGYSAILYLNPKRNGKGLEAFLYKIKIAPIEPFKTKIDVDNWKDFNDNYRSYENIITIKQVSRKGIGTILFGEGLGSTLNLGRKVLSNDATFVQYIPIVHNGYMTVFLKSGLVGDCFLIMSIIFLFRQKKSKIYSVVHLNYLLVGTSIFLIVSNWVFLGLYLKLDNKSIIIGFLIAIKEILIKDNTYQTSIADEK
ncbi:MAG: hypothetical protein H7239_01030 [Flavobacterium sp.]|nr:hypothetical protein [Flavobacterium sp.]